MKTYTYSYQNVKSPPRPYSTASGTRPAQGFALIVHTPGVSPPQGFALGYGPPGLQPGRVQGSAL